MKKFILTIFTGLALIAVSCKPDDTKTDVTAVAFGDDSIVLSVGLTQPLSFVVSPLGANDEALTWSSSSDAVATVDQDGWITAIAPGTATITAKSANGKTATCEVTVIIPVAGLSLNAKELTLSVDATFTLVASVYPEGATDQDVIWSSSNEDVATVDEDGVVTAIALGTATITAKSANGASAKCKVIVDSPVIDVTSVTLDKTSLTLLVDSTYTLVATIAPDTASYQDITWSSSDEKVATVDKDGFVTAIAAGTATITAQSTNEEVSAVCEVTVNAPIDVTSISFGEISLVMEVASTQTVVVNVLPTDATYTDIIWSSSDEEVATVEDGVVTAVAAGTAIIRAEAMYGVSAEFVLTVNEPAEE